jgi:hypothetical protein
VIEDIINGDITSPQNPRDIIIGMNTDLHDVTGIGLRFVKNLIPLKALDLGSVLTFDFDAQRKLHMIICHHLGPSYWYNADQHVRFGMDYLHYMNDSGRKYSIVRIGTGRIGQRDKADHAAIHKAMAESYLPVNLYTFDPKTAEAVTQVERAPLVATAAWNPSHGPIPLQMAA